MLVNMKVLTIIGTAHKGNLRHIVRETAYLCQTVGQGTDRKPWYNDCHSYRNAS